MRVRRISLSGAAAATLALVTMEASAQETQGAFQIGLDTSIFDYTNASTDVEVPGNDIESDTKTTRWGIRQGVALELGYGVTDMLVFGGILRLGGESSTTDVDLPGTPETETSDFDVFIGPKLDVMFMPGSSARPFIGVAPGFVSSSSDDGTTDVSVQGFELGFRAGVRWFPVEGFSLDPALGFAWTTASGDIDSGALDADVSGSGYGISILLGASGWVL